MLTSQRLRTARTKLVNRWHAAQTTGERLGNDAVGERFEHINHARSLAEYVWCYGVFDESADATGRIARQDIPYSLREVVAPVAAKGPNHLRIAGRVRRDGRPVERFSPASREPGLSRPGRSSACSRPLRRSASSTASCSASQRATP